MLAAICIVANAAKGVSSLQLSRDMNVQYKTAFVFSHKLREAMAAETAGHTLDGEIEIDGQYHGGHIRPANLVDPALETAHAIAWMVRERARWSANEVILVCVSGRGDKDVAQVMEMGILDG